MSVGVYIVSGGGVKNHVSISKNGEMIVRPYDYDSVVSKILTIDNQGYTFFSPKVGFNFVVTSIILTADKNVNTDCIVDVYETSEKDSTSIIKSIIQIEMATRSSRDIVGLNLLITEGSFLNVKTDDNNVNVSIMGHYLPV